MDLVDGSLLEEDYVENMDHGLRVRIMIVQKSKRKK